MKYTEATPSGVPVGRTGWDILAASQQKIVIVLVLLGVGALLFFGRQYLDTEIVEGILIGAGLGYLLASYLLRPTGRFLLIMDMESSGVRLVFLTEDVYARYNKAGNSCCFTSYLGMPVYLARSIDEEMRIIDYGFYHEAPPEVVFADVDLYNKWADKLVQVQTENITLRDHAAVLGAELAKKAADGIVRDFSKALGIEDESEDSADVSRTTEAAAPVLSEESP